MLGLVFGFVQAPLSVELGLRLLELVVMGRAILRPHRQPASRIAWIVVIMLVPILGVLAYLLLGETNIGRRRAERARKVIADMPPIQGELAPANVPRHYEHLFRTASSISPFVPWGGNTARLSSDSDATIDGMVADFDAARDHIHVLFYIWLEDRNGTRVAEALERAAGRGVVCRVMADGLGSRSLIRSELWKRMERAGVRMAVALPIGNPLRPFVGRIDLRNHRKIVVVDGHVTWCGSQNCADAAFRVKAKYAPWVDVVMRFEGPVARQNQQIFVGDWLVAVDEDLSELLAQPVEAPTGGFIAQAFGTGPTVRYSAMPEMFESLMFAARREIVITTPYYVPDDSMQNALCAAALRGVETTLVLPARNDSFIVAAASRSYYAELLEAGVKLFEYVGGLLHAKTFTLDGEITLIGSANMDRRSFELNYENNILLHDEQMTGEVRRLQDEWISRSEPVLAADVAAWPVGRRLWNQTIAMFGPIL